MDPTVFVVIAGIFTIFGYIWGKMNGNIPKWRVETIVFRTMTYLEEQGYLKSKMIDGELHYLKWDNEHDNHRSNSS